MSNKVSTVTYIKKNVNTSKNFYLRCVSGPRKFWNKRTTSKVKLCVNNTRRPKTGTPIFLLKLSVLSSRDSLLYFVSLCHFCPFKCHPKTMDLRKWTGNKRPQGTVLSTQVLPMLLLHILTVHGFWVFRLQRDYVTWPWISTPDCRVHPEASG